MKMYTVTAMDGKEKLSLEESLLLAQKTGKLIVPAGQLSLTIDSNIQVAPKEEENVRL